MIRLEKMSVVLACGLIVSACGDTVYDPRGVEKAETLLSVSASGQADMRPDEARFQAGVQNWAGNAEAAANTAYANAYAAARSRAEAYAEAADMEISRVLYIRDAGGSQGNRYMPGAMQVTEAVRTSNVAPPPPPAPPAIAMPAPEEGGYSATIMPGQTTSSVNVQVDFALVEK